MWLAIGIRDLRGKGSGGKEGIRTIRDLSSKLFGCLGLRT